jgi:hypothetical protein
MALACCALCVACSAVAQTPQTPPAPQAQDSDPNFPISTDRPSFTDGTTTVPVGHPQIEAGITNTSLQGTRTTTYGETTYRQALSSDFELRLLNLTYAVFTGGGPQQTGLLDPSIGFKWRFQNGVYTGKFRRPELGVELVTSVPVGSAAFRTNTFQPSARLLMQYNTDANTQWFGNVIVSSFGAGSNEFIQYAVSGGVSYSINPRLGAYVEGYALMPEVRVGPTGSFADAGFTYLLNKRTQVDVRYGTGFNQRRDGSFVGAGFAYRF